MAGVLDYDNVVKDYAAAWSRKRVRALDGFNLSLKRGEIFGFLGPNGAGKTTAIHLAVGFMRPSAGSGRLLGRPFGETAVRARVGFLPENVVLHRRPAEKLLRVYGALNRMRDPELRRRTVEVLRQVELETEAARNVGTLSRGMQQRIGLAQALINDPELLILDEPTSALDPLARVAVRELLLAANSAGQTIFLSSHILSEIEMICHRVGIVREGKMVRIAPISDLLAATEMFEITARGVPAADVGGRASDDGTVIVQVDAGAQRASIQRIWTLGGEVLKVSPMQRTLEEVFVSLTQKGPTA